MKPKCFQCPAWSKKMGDYRCARHGWSYDCDYCRYGKGEAIGKAVDSFETKLTGTGAVGVDKAKQALSALCKSLGLHL